MKFKGYILILYFVLCKLHIFIRARPLIGENVQNVTEGEFNFVVSISKMINTKASQHFCTGSLVSNRDVLTAEHCMFDQDIQRIRVIVGSVDLRNGVKHSTLWWIGYEQWAHQSNRQLEYLLNDLAILRLKKQVNSQIIPIPLCNTENSALFGLHVEIPGWGLANDRQLPMILKKINVTVLEHEDCERRNSAAVGRRMLFQLNVFCSAGTTLTLVQMGDSGSPVLLSNTIVGVTKGTCPFPELEVHPDKVNMHFGILFYRTFIFDIISNWK